MARNKEFMTTLQASVEKVRLRIFSVEPLICVIPTVYRIAPKFLLFTKIFTIAITFSQCSNRSDVDLQVF